MTKITTAEEALKVVKSGDFVYIQGGAAVPEILVDALVKRAPELRNVTIGHIHIEGDAPFAQCTAYHQGGQRFVYPYFLERYAFAF